MSAGPATMVLQGISRSRALRSCLVIEAMLGAASSSEVSLESSWSSALAAATFHVAVPTRFHLLKGAVGLFRDLGHHKAVVAPSMAPHLWQV